LENEVDTAGGRVFQSRLILLKLEPLEHPERFTIHAWFLCLRWPRAVSGICLCLIFDNQNIS
jgi:hypothetical protein